MIERIIICFLLVVAAASAQETTATESTPAADAAVDSAQVQGIVFHGVVQDSSFAAGEKLNVEILESGEALQTTVGTPFSVVLPEDTLWNVCVTNSDTAGAEKEKCYELVYTGNEGSFSQALGEAFVNDSVAQGPDSAKVGASAELGRSKPAEPTVAEAPKPAEPTAAEAKKPAEDVDVDALLAGGDNTKVTELKKVVVQLRRRQIGRAHV